MWIGTFCCGWSKAICLLREADKHKLILEIKQLKRQELESFVVCNVDRSARQAETKKPKIVPKNIMTRTTLHNLDPNFHQSCTSRNVKLTFWWANYWNATEICLKHWVCLSYKFQEVSFSRTIVRSHFRSVTLSLRLVVLVTNFVSLHT